MKLKKSIAALATAVLVTGVGAMSAAAAPAAAPADVLERVAAAEQTDAPDPDDVGILALSAPRTIRVGADVTPFVMTVQTGQPMDFLAVDVIDRDSNSVGVSDAVPPVSGRPNVFKPTVYVYADDLISWGPHAIVFGAGRDEADLYAGGFIETEIRAHSLLGMRASTSGSTTTLQGSARAFNTTVNRYASWSGRPVSVQRWTGSAWVQVTGVTTDSRGNFTTSVRVPAGSELRAVVKDVPAIWGAVSATVKA